MMDQVKIVCKCIPGFERISLNECREKLEIDEGGTEMRGRIYFNININNISTLQKLRSVSHYWVVVSEKENYFSSFENNEDIFADLVQLPTKLCWKNALRTWREFKMKLETKPAKKVNHVKTENGDLSNGVIDKGDLTVKAENGDFSNEVIDKGDLTNCDMKNLKIDNETIKDQPKKDLTEIDPLTAADLLSFRATAYRTGNHPFTSMDTARHFGSGINDTFEWKVDMTKFDIEVVLYVRDSSLTVGIQLTKDDQASRNITHFGPTTLRASICYGLLKFAEVAPGDIVCDPMCGSSSISIEGALSCPNSFQIAGENHPIAMEHSADNIADIEKETHELYSLPASVVHWDVYQLPLRTATIDKIITDLPFGKRMGNRERNMFLYPVALREMARICRPQGKAVLLTQHKAALARAVKKTSYWQTLEVRKIMMGGLDVVAYLLIRSDDVYQPRDPNEPEEERTEKPVDEKNLQQGGETVN